MTDEQMREEIQKRVAKLRPRERDVLRLIVLGRDGPSIGRTLNISPHTAKFHVANITATLGVQSREVAAVLGWVAGLVAAEDLERALVEPKDRQNEGTRTRASEGP